MVPVPTMCSIKDLKCTTPSCRDFPDLESGSCSPQSARQPPFPTVAFAQRLADTQRTLKLSQELPALDSAGFAATSLASLAPNPTTLRPCRGAFLTPQAGSPERRPSLSQGFTGEPFWGKMAFPLNMRPGGQKLKGLIDMFYYAIMQ